MNGCGGRGAEAPGTTPVRPAATERGLALLVTLVILVVIGVSSGSFLWFMQQQQTRAGARYRASAAIAVAEAGIHRALSVLEALPQNGSASGRLWRPAAHSEQVRVGPLEGRFTLSIAEETGGALVVTAVGDVAGVTRRLRARVHLASPALLASLNGASIVRLERPPASTFLLPYRAIARDWPWIHLAAGRGIWLAAGDVSINNPSAVVTTLPGPLDALAQGAGAPPLVRYAPVRLALPRSVEVLLGPDRQHVDVGQLRAMGAHIQGDVVRSDAFAQFPEVSRTFYETLAATNVANAHLNKLAGQYVGDDDFARKQGSLYSQREFEQLQRYLASESAPARITGVIYVRGSVTLHKLQPLRIVDGTLVTEGTVLVGAESSLEITHTAATRALPGVITLDYGPLIVARGAQLRVHGLVYASRVIYVDEQARLDVVGSVLGRDEALSFRNPSGIVVIRYDPAVLGTPGLLVPVDAPVLVWVSDWREVP